MKKTLTRCLGALTAGLILVSCASTVSPTQKPPGFLADYSILKPVTNSNPDIKIFGYKNPQVSRSDYHAVIVEPVVLYQGATDGGVTNEQIAAAKKAIADDLKQQLSTKIKITNQAGAGVASLNVAITGAIIEGDGFKPRNLMPISAAIKLASKATGLDNKKTVLIIETKVLDSVSNKLLSASYTTISGDEFRLGSSTPAEFLKVAKLWVKEAVKAAVPND